ncbi:fungal-specific transcription factor domain-containing protein [Ilyonectria destructans]|nr:fungal-specific transcription factor domain-containing protein [Ilyonectria destructans]
MLSPPHNPDAHPTRTALSCNQCDRTFSRPSHLNRHRLTHLPPSRRNTIPCLYCDQTFSRKDVLLRHLRAAHHVDLPTNSSQQKSCYRCVRRKLKCDRALPCRSCAVAAATEPCSYPPTDQAFGAGSQLLDQSYDASTTMQSASDSGSRQNDQSDFATASPETFSSLSQPLDPLLLNADQFSPVFSGGPALAGETTMFGPSMNTSVQFDFRCSGFDWLDFDAPDVELAINCVVGDVAIPASTSILPGSLPSVSIHAIPAVQAKSPVLPWPFEQGQETASARCPLPPLREVLQNSLRSSSGTKTAALEGLVQILSEQKLPKPEDVTEPNMAMGIDLLKRLLDVYFSAFQMIQPIFHTPTWSMRDCPTMLLAPMACIGAVLSSEPNSAELSASISDFCAPIITWLGVSDSANYSDISYLASLCLHQIYSLGSGNRQLYQNADRTRGVLIGSLRGLGLLKSRPSVQEDGDMNNSMTPHGISLDAEWVTWAAREKEIRIAWASFEYDCSLCTLTSRRGAVDLSELPSKLPCMDSLWEAPSAGAWVALKSRMPSNALGASVSGVIGAAIAGTPIPGHLSAWGKRLCSQVIGRLLWDLKQLELVSTTEYFGLSSLSTGQKQSKASLLQALDCLLETMNHPASTGDLVSYNISSLLCHYSHLYTADDIMDMILYIVRSVASRGSTQDNGVDLARRRLISALGNDPRRARTLAWHAGQIVAVANEYLVSAPCEIMRLFMSYIFIIAFAQYYPRPQQPDRGAQVRLDLPNHHADQKRAIEDWIQTGGPARIGSAEDILAQGSTKIIIQDAQVMLQRLRSWGLAEKFAKILQCFENNGD